MSNDERINEPPFGGKGMTKAEGSDAHKRWIENLGQYPSDYPAGSIVRTQYENGQQCGLCRFYVSLEGSLGMDWGACANDKSIRDGTVVFEHFSCPAFKQQETADEDKE